MIKTVNVFLNHFDDKIFVGKLALKNRKIYFEYDLDFIQKNINLSPYLLPLKKELQVCNDNVLMVYLEFLQIVYLMVGENCF